MRSFYVFFIAMLSFSFGYAQCNYSLELRDLFGDGWNRGSQITVTIAGGAPTVYTIPTGSVNTIVLTVNDGDSIELDYIEDSLSPAENSYILFDSDGMIVFDSGFAPRTEVNTLTASCPACATVSNITSDNIMPNSAEISWTAGGVETTWIIEYGVSPYTCGSGGMQQSVTSNPATISGLSSITEYDVYVISDCGMGDLSSCEGPVSFTTPESCISPSNFAPVNNTSNSVSFIWDANGNTSGIVNIEYAPEGTITAPFSDPPQGTVIQQLTAPFANVTGLNADTCYDFYVQIDCGMGDLSLAAGPYQACTPISCFPVNALQASSTGANSINASWLPGQSETEWQVEYAPIGTITAPFSDPSQGTITTVNATNVNITSLVPDTGYDIYVRAVCDLMLSDFSQPEQIQAFTGCLPLIATTASPYIQDFESFTATTSFSRENCWSATFAAQSNTNQYELAVSTNGTTPSINNTGPDSANSGTNFVFAEAGSGSDGDIATLISPTINIDGLTEPSVQFAYFFFGVNVGSLSVDVWDGTTWQTGLLEIPGQVQTSGSDPWVDAIVNLAGFTGDIQVRFVFTKNGIRDNGDMAIDDFSVEEAPACAPVTLLGTGAISTSDAELLWTSQGSENDWIIEYGPAGFTPGTASTDPNVFEVATGTNPSVISGLVPATLYDFYVTADCGSSTLSTKVGPKTFATAFLPPQGVTCSNMDNLVFYTEDFNSGEIGEWTGDVGTSNGSWDFTETEGTGSTGTGPLGPHEGEGYVFFDTSGTNVGRRAMVSPPIDLSTATDEAELSFFLHSFGGDLTTFEVGVGTSPTGPFTNVFTSIGPFQIMQTESFTPVGVMLPMSVLGSSTVYLEFAATEEVGKETNTRGDIAIDLLQIETCGEFCFPPDQIMVDMITTTSAEISFTDTNLNPAGNYEYLVIPNGDPAPDSSTTGVQMTTTTTTGNVWPGLASSSDFDVYVRTDCMGVAGFSEWSGPVTFRTLCADLIAPFTESFDLFDQEPTCWILSEAGGTPWEFDGGIGFNTAACSTPASDNTGNGGSFGWVDLSEDIIEGQTAAVVLETPQIDVSALTIPYLDFYHWMCTTGYSPANETYVEANDGTGTWTQVALINTGDAIWTRYGFDISSFVYNTNFVQLRFRVESGGDFGAFRGDIALDDVSVIEAPLCSVPTDFTVAGVTGTTADIGWTSNNTPVAPDFDINYAPVGTITAPGTGQGDVELAVTTNSFQLTGLIPNTVYEYYVKANCGVGNESMWEGPSREFITGCVPFTVTYTNNFDADPLGDLNNCDLSFLTPIDPPATTSASVEVANLIPNSGGQHINMFSGNIVPAEIFYISPEFSDLSNDKRVRFFVYDEDKGGIEVGVMTDPTDPSTFTSVQTFTDADLADDQYQPVSVNFSSIAINGGHVAIKFNPQGNFDEMYIDDFIYEDIPLTCPEPTALISNGVGEADVDLSWTVGSTETEWIVEYATPNFATGTVQQDVGVVNNTNYVLSGLTADTLYEVRVVAVCGLTDTSPVSFPIAIKTLPASPVGVTCSSNNAVFIWEETFDNGINGWTGSTGTANGNWDFTGSAGTGTPRTGPLGPQQGSNYVFFDASGTNVGARSMVSPAIDMSAATDEAELSFFFHSFGGDLTSFEIAVGTSPTGPFTNVFAFSGPLQTSQNDDFIHIGASLPASVLGSATVHIQLTATEEVGNEGGFVGDVALDLMRIQTCADICSNPDMLSVTITTPTSVDATFNDTNGTPAGNYEYVVQVADTGVPMTAGTAITTTSFTESNLTPDTSYEIYVRSNCDTNGSSAWVGPVNFTTQCNVLSAPYFEDFESFTAASIFPTAEDYLVNENCWNTANSNLGWVVARTTLGGSGGTGPAPNVSTGNYIYTESNSVGSGGVAELFSPLIDLSPLTTPELSFDYHLFGDDIGTFEVIINVAGNETVIRTFTGQVQSTEDEIFLNEVIDLNAYAGQTIQLVFRHTSQLGAFIAETDGALDNIEIREPLACRPPSAITVSEISSAGPSIEWVENGSATVWEVEIQPKGVAQGTVGAAYLNTNAVNPESVTGLNPSTDYDIYIRANCGAGDFSTWVGPVSFSTPCAPIIPPYGTYVMGGDNTAGNDFSSVTFPDTCWEEGDDTDIATGPNGSNGAWRDDDFVNISSNPFGEAASIIIWNTTPINDWLVTPDFDLGATTNYSVIFNIAQVDFNTTNPNGFDGDQQVQFLISEDHGTTWSNLQTWDATTPAITTAEEVIIDLSAYSGVVRFAFWGSNGTNTGNNNTEFYVDNFIIDAVASNDSSELLGFNYYPNPTKDYLDITGDVTIDTITVTNLLGQQVVELNPGNTSARVDLTDLSIGLYLVRVSTGDKESTVRVIKQ